MSTELDRKVEEMTAGIAALAAELRDKSDIGLDRIKSIETEIARRDAELEELLSEKRADDAEARIANLEERVKAFTPAAASAKAAAIMAGAQGGPAPVKTYGNYSETNFLSALVDARAGSGDAQEFIKAVLGTSVATGTAIVPNNFVDALVEQIAAGNIYRGLFNVTGGVTGTGVDIPYEITGLQAALLQGAYGSNKDVRDFSFNRATATLYTIAQIADIGNQLLRQSGGQAEAVARRRLGKQIAIAEAQFITNGTGSSQPLGFFQAFLAFGDPAGFKTTLSSESRAAAIGRGIAALEARGILSDNLVVVMNPTDYWELAVETLGTSGSGGWVLDPAGGAAGSPPVTSLWGVPVKRDPWWPAAQAGTALIIDTPDVDMYTGQEYRITVSDSGGSRFEQNVTGFRAEEEFAFNAEPYIRTGRVQKVLGL